MSDAAPPVYDPIPSARPPHSLAARLLLWTLLTAIGGLALFGAIVAWRWTDDNLLGCGVRDQGSEVTNQARLLEQVRAFQLATVKQTFEAQTSIDLAKTLRAGPVKLNLPGWAAGQRLDAKGSATVTAGVDLAGVGSEDMTVTREGKETRVTIRLPAPRLLSTELVPGSLDLSTSVGVITRLRQSAGLKETDLRDRAADEVAASAKQAALDQGIIEAAAAEAERRLTAFLATLPRGSGERVSYTVVVERPATR